MRALLFLLLLPALSVAAEFTLPVAPNGTGYSCWFGDDAPTRHQRYGTALRTCIEKQMADPTKGYEILMREVAAPVATTPPPAFQPDLTYRSTAPSADSIHLQAPAGSTVEVDVLTGTDVRINTNGSANAITPFSFAVRVNGGQPEVFEWLAP